jgi:hypothetical protein
MLWLAIGGLVLVAAGASALGAGMWRGRWGNRA